MKFLFYVHSNLIKLYQVFDNLDLEFVHLSLLKNTFYFLILNPPKMKILQLQIFFYLSYIMNNLF